MFKSVKSKVLAVLAAMALVVLFVAAIGFREAQRTTSGKAWTALLLPFLAVCACCCAAGWMMISGLSSLRVHGS